MNPRAARRARLARSEQIANRAYPSTRSCTGSSALKNERLHNDSERPRSAHHPTASWQLVGPRSRRSRRSSTSSTSRSLGSRRLRPRDGARARPELQRVDLPALARSRRRRRLAHRECARVEPPAGRSSRAASGRTRSARSPTTQRHTRSTRDGRAELSGDSEAGVGIYASTTAATPGAAAGEPGGENAGRSRRSSSTRTTRARSTSAPPAVCAASRGHRRRGVARARRPAVGPLEDHRRRQTLLDGLGRACVAARRQPRRDGPDPQHALRGRVPAGHLALVDGGTTWEQVFATQDPTENTARTEFALEHGPGRRPHPDLRG